MNITTWIQAFFELIFPRQCVVCNRLLNHTEKFVCIICNINLPRTNYHKQKDNIIEERFWGLIPIQRATAFFYYRKGSDYCNIIYELKYKGCKEIGSALGSDMANEIQDSGFFDGIDVIVPIPLHRDRIRKRGYNQSEWIAKGIAEITNIPVNTGAVARKAYRSQVGQSVLNRWDNVKDTFVLQQPEMFTGKHILIVDDVLTTGATIIACAQAFLPVQGIRISIITLGMAH
jgi:ComF family protein